MENNTQTPFEVEITKPKKTETKINTFGIFGFSLSFVGLIIGWFPIFGWIAWIPGTILSIIGATKESKKIAYAGCIISTISLIIMIFVFVKFGFFKFDYNIELD